MNAIEIIAQILTKINFEGTFCSAKCKYLNYSKESFSFFDKESDTHYTYGESMDIPCLVITTSDLDEEGNWIFDEVKLPVNSVNFEHVLEVADMYRIGFTKEDVVIVTQVMADILRKVYHLVNGNRLVETFTPCSEDEVVSKYLFALKQTASVL